MNLIYPFGAVVGQEPLKLALLLNAIDPAIGGVLVQGQRGVAKTTLARALGELVMGHFVELPLGASEERVTGTLDLSAALQAGRVEFSPGLLARAHEGVLYVDEVNLLPDALVDLLLDAAGSGRNTVERDGVSHVHAARFVLIGTMNPEEGELRPQLTDRFGLSVVAEGELSPAVRTEIVLRRLDFERDPQAFRSRFSVQQSELAARCQAARERVGKIALAGPAVALVAEHCHAARVEGVRADLAMLRAARAHAAWQGRDTIEEADVEAVVELALGHRRAHGSGSTGGSTGSSSGPSGRTPPRNAPPSSPSSAPSASPGEKSAGAGSTASSGALSAVPVQARAVTRVPSFGVLTQGRAEQRRKGARARSARRGLRVRGEVKSGAIDWFATLASTRRPRFDQLRYRARKVPHKQLWVLAIDCSMSMLRSGGLAAAKGLAQALHKRAHRAGAHVALIAFGGEYAQLTADTRASRSATGRALEQLTAGGGTPLREAVVEALSLCEQRSFRSNLVAKRIVLATDGRTRQQVADLQCARSDLEILVVDCERSTVRLGRATQLAQQLNASCVHVDSL